VAVRDNRSFLYRTDGGYTNAAWLSKETSGRRIFQDWIVPLACLGTLFDREGASFVLLDDARVGPLAAAFIDSFQDLCNRCVPGPLEPAGGRGECRLVGEPADEADTSHETADPDPAG
jgi:hypothetical protein